MYQHGTFAPILVPIAWTFVMWLWMYATRIPAMRQAKVDLAELSRTGAKLTLPARVTRVVVCAAASRAFVDSGDRERHRGTFCRL